jgi:hypothetical protein
MAMQTLSKVRDGTIDDDPEAFRNSRTVASS